MDTINGEIASQEDESLSKLNKIVNDTILEEALVINNLLHPPKEILSHGQKLSHRIFRLAGAGSYYFIPCDQRGLDRVQCHRHEEIRVL